MRLFRKSSNQTTADVPAELQPYYERGGWRLWVRRAVLVLLALALVFLLFWAGRAVYRQVTGNDEATQTQQEGNEQQSEQAPQDGEAERDTAPHEEGANTNGGEGANGGDEAAGDGAADEDNRPTNEQPGATIPATGDDETQPAPLPATGG